MSSTTHRRLGAAAAVTSALAGALSGQAQTMYAIGAVAASPQSLLTVDLTSGAATQVDPTETFLLGNSGTALSCDGTLYGFSMTGPTTGDLFTVDLATGVHTLVQSLTLAPAAPPFGQGIGLAFAADGTARLLNDTNLYRLDVESGEIHLVGPTGLSSQFSLTTGRGPDCRLFATGLLANWSFIAIDPDTAASTTLGASVANLTALEFDDTGRLFASRLNTLVELDPADGRLLRTAGPFGFDVPGMALDVPTSCFVTPAATITAPNPICAGVTATLSGAGSSACGAAGLRYRWRDGAAVLCDWSTSPDCAVTPVVSTVYELDVQCVNAPGSCTATEALTVAVNDCPLAVVFDRVAVEVEEGPSGRRACLTWWTLLEEGTLGFAVESGGRADGPFTARATVATRGPGVDYRQCEPYTAGASWYRVVEIAAAGDGSVSPVVRAVAPGPAGRGGRRR